MQRDGRGQALAATRSRELLLVSMPPANLRFGVQSGVRTFESQKWEDNYPRERGFMHQSTVRIESALSVNYVLAESRGQANRRGISIGARRGESLTTHSGRVTRKVNS